MARIRIVENWLRNPASPPQKPRAVMVVAERWEEQRVLLRAYTQCRDQTRPTVVLHGRELAIGPAGAEPYGPWGIHVDAATPGRAQELQGQLELAARRLAQSLADPSRGAADSRRTRRGFASPLPPAGVPAPSAATLTGVAPVQVRRGLPAAAAGPRAAIGPGRAAISQLVGRTLPMGLALSDAEKDVLDRLGEKPSLGARDVAHMAGVADGDAWMEQLIAKLAGCGIDAIGRHKGASGETTYLLRR